MNTEPTLDDVVGKVLEGIGGFLAAMIVSGVAALCFSIGKRRVRRIAARPYKLPPPGLSTSRLLVGCSALGAVASVLTFIQHDAPLLPLTAIAAILVAPGAYQLPYMVWAHRQGPAPPGASPELPPPDGPGLPPKPSPRQLP